MRLSRAVLSSKSSFNDLLAFLFRLKSRCKDLSWMWINPRDLEQVFSSIIQRFQSFDDAFRLAVEHRISSLEQLSLTCVAHKHMFMWVIQNLNQSETVVASMLCHLKQWSFWRFGSGTREIIHAGSNIFSGFSNEQQLFVSQKTLLFRRCARPLVLASLEGHPIIQSNVEWSERTYLWKPKSSFVEKKKYCTIVWEKYGQDMQDECFFLECASLKKGLSKKILISTKDAMSLRDGRALVPSPLDPQDVVPSWASKWLRPSKQSLLWARSESLRRNIWDGETWLRILSNIAVRIPTQTAMSSSASSPLIVASSEMQTFFFPADVATFSCVNKESPALLESMCLKAEGFWDISASRFDDEGMVATLLEREGDNWLKKMENDVSWELWLDPMLQREEERRQNLYEKTVKQKQKSQEKDDDDIIVVQAVAPIRVPPVSSDILIQFASSSISTSQDAFQSSYTQKEIDPKSFWTNERTLLSWIPVSIFLATSCVALLGLGSPLPQIGGLMMYSVAMLACAYSLVRYFLRNRAIRVGLSADAFGVVDLWGPWVLVILLSSCIIVLVVLVLQSPIQA